MIFESERLYVRKFTSTDLDSFYRMNSDEEVMRYIRPVKDLEECRQFLDENLRFYDEHPSLGRFALFIKRNEDFVGSFSLLPLEHTDDIHIGYALLKPYWGQGLATEILKAGLVHAFEKVGLSTITGVTYPQNLPSQQVLLKCGFQFEKSFLEDGVESFLYRKSARDNQNK